MKSGHNIIIEDNKLVIINLRQYLIGVNEMIRKLFFALFVFSAFGCAGFSAQEKISYEGYSLKFEDNFDGSKLDTKKWGFEFHEPGWVNNELQSYDDSKENTYVKDGNLVIQALEKNNGGKKTYTSGRINTLGKFEAKYGIFEARLKVPQGQGFLPAFWMMPANEQIYGQWPLCGEIDIMEVLGNDIKKSYSTLHFGEPHTQKQVFKTLKKGDFANEFHTYAVEWLPDEFKFYVDGEYIGSVTEWFTKKAGDEPVTFPAPYDQPYYMILNVAVGGNWPGNPDHTTKFDERAQMVVDYVRVYQKDSYDENVTMKEAEVKVRGADGKNGNLVRQSKNSWEYMQQLGGEGAFNYNNGVLEVTTKKAGTVDYSVQLVQADIPLVKGAYYEFSFDAWSTENRSTMVGLTGPNNGFVRYFGDEKISLTKNKKNYKFKFQMKETTDPACRIDFNMGATSSTAPIYISNVVIKQVGKGAIETAEKSVTADGNYIYNGTFDRGYGRMKYWKAECADGSSQEVTNVKNVRECKVVVGKAGANAVVLSQDKIPLASDTEYVFTLESSTKNVDKAKLFVNDTQIKLVKSGKGYKAVFNAGKCGATSTFKMVFENKGEYRFDNIRMVENALLKNGSFAKGMAGWELYTYSSADAEVQAKDKAVITINDTNDAEWKIQLKQNNVSLKKGAKYVLSFDISSTKDREVKYALQRDGARWKTLHGVEDWVPYNNGPVVNAKKDVQHVEQEFTMKYADDDFVILTFSLAAVNGKKVKGEHKITISNVKLIEK